MRRSRRPTSPRRRTCSSNGGAEDGLAGWSGTFTAEAYGSPLLPTRHSGQVLGGGHSFFSAAEAAEADLFQRIDATGAADPIDAGLGRATLAGIVGGYGADADTLVVQAVFKDPENRTLGRIVLPAVTAADRLNGTNLLPRSALAPIPPRTRAIDVLLHGARAAGSYTDAYVDSLALALSVPGVPVAPPGEPTDPPVDGLEPFDGVAVLTAQPRFTRGGVASVLLACADTTVGACRGTLALRARGRAIAPRVGFAVRPGIVKTVSVRLFEGAPRPPRQAVLAVQSFDGQGLMRRATVPVSLVLPARRG